MFVRQRKAILVHGCFWHGHTCKEGKRQPKSNRDFWNAKIAATREREAKNNKLLIEQGWRLLILWECEIEERHFIEEQLTNFVPDLQP